MPNDDLVHAVRTRVPTVSVIGDARLEDETAIATARQLGAALMTAGFRVVTGGLGGLMAEVSQGARSSPDWKEGRIIGILPSYRLEDANPWCDVIIPTGMQMARNVLVVATGDVVLAVGGGSGTLSEIAIAWQLGRPIVALGHAGWAGKLAGATIDTRSSEPVSSADTIADAVRLCSELCSRPRSGDDIGSRWRHSR